MFARTSSKIRSVNVWLLALCLIPVAGFAQSAEAPKRPQFREPPVAEAAALQAAGAESEAPVVALRAQRQLENDTLCLTYNRERPGPTIYMDPASTHRIHLENQLRPFTAGELEQFDPPVLMPGEPKEVADFLAASSGVTNLHTHGLHVSPRGRSDNVLLKINPKRANLYALSLPPDHAPGTHWYHAHLHGSTALQVQGGMSGALIVRPPAGQSLNPPGFQVTERIMVLQVDCSKPPSEPVLTLAATLGKVRSIDVESLPERLRSLTRAETDRELESQIDALSEGDQRAVARSLGELPVDPPRFILNRLLNPTLEVAAGRFQRLRIVNSGSRRDDYKDVWIEGHDLYLAAFDGVNLTHLPKERTGSYVAYNEQNPLVLAPGNRADLYFLPSVAGEHALMMRGEARVRLTTETELLEPFTQELLTFQVSEPAEEEGESQAEESGESELERFLKALDANLVRLQGTRPYQTYLKPFGSAPSLQRDMEFNILGSGRTRTFTINGRDYNEIVNGGMRGHVDYLGKEKGDGGRGPDGQTPWPPRTGTEEAWTITNPSGQKHPFHIHVSPFWVYDIRENGVSVRETNPNDPRIDRWQDTITLPANGGSVTIWHRFSEFEGLFVVHCHILQHEDRGMMINILLVPKDNKDPAGYFKKEMAANCKINNEINGTTTDCSKDHE